MRYNTKRGFTLIELLVVVLIIGILAAVAVPQYQVSVTKSRYLALKQYANSILQAEEVYYLANGKYTNVSSMLDLSFPPSTTITCYLVSYNSDQSFYVNCSDSQINMAYQTYSKRLGEGSVCLWKKTNAAIGAQKVCQQETRRSSVYTSADYKLLYYPLSL